MLGGSTFKIRSTLINADTASENTPACSMEWLSLTIEEQLQIVNLKLIESQFIQIFKISRIRNGRELFVSFTAPQNAGVRGKLLLDFEMYIKDKIDQGLIVWCEPIGDRNSLRNLRGVEIKK